jgi:hypothetical protein
MDNLIETIRAAMMPDASDEARAAGATACRAVLATLDAQAGQPLAAAPVAATPIQAAVTAMSGLPSDQLLDLAIAKLRSMLPEGTTIEPVPPLKLPLLPLPVGGR